MFARCRYLALVAAPVAWFGAAVRVPLPDPVATAISPATVLPGQNITVSGSNLARVGYTAELQYTKKYLAAGEAATGVVSAASQSATQLVFVAPSNARPVGFALIYRSDASGVALAAAAAPARDTSFASRAPFAIPGRVDVLEVPVVLAGNQGVVVTPAGSVQLLLPGAMELNGRNLVAAPGAQVSVSFNGVAVPQSGAARYDATANGGGADIIPLQVAEPSANTVGTMTVTTPGGTGSNASFLIMRRPRIVGVDEVNSVGTVVGTSGGRLVRGERYQIRGSDLAFPAAAPFALGAHVLLGTTPASNVVTMDAGRVQFTVPTTLTATSVELTVSAAAGLPGSAGMLSISDPGARPPALADVGIAPSAATWGTSLSATIAFAGSVAPGANIGNVVISSPTPGDFVGLPITVPITSNPQTVTIPTRVRAVSGTRTVRVRLARLTGSVDSLDRQVQLTAPSLTGLALGASSAGGGEIVTANLSFDFPAGVATSCGIAPLTPPDLRVDVTVSDSSVANVANPLGGSGTGVCVTGNPTQVRLQTRIVSAARTVQVTARLGQSTRTASLTVLSPTLTGVKVDRPALTSMQTAVGSIVMNSPMAGASVVLSSNDPAVSVPAKISLGSGLTTTFPITTAPVATGRTVTITAAVNGVTQSATITLAPLQFTSVTLSPSAVRAGANIAATIALNATVDVPFTATLTSSDPSVATLPASVSFAARQSTAVFNVQVRSPQSQSKSVTIGVAYTVTLPNGGVVTARQSGVLMVTP